MDVQVGHRGRSIAILGGLGRIGTFVGPALGGFVGAVLGLRIPFLFFAGLGVLCLISVLAWVKDDGGSAARGRTAYPLASVFRAHYRSLITAGSGQLCAQLIRAARHAVIPLYGAETLGLELDEVGLIVSLSSAIDMLMFYPAGQIMDRWGRKHAYVPSFIIQSAGMALIPLAGGFSGLLGVSLLIGLGNGLGSGTMMTLGADLAPAEARGEFLGLWCFIGDIGNAGGPMSRSPRVFQDVGALESVRKDLPVGTRQLSFERYENDLVTTLGKWGSIPRSVENYERAIAVS